MANQLLKFIPEEETFDTVEQRKVLPSLDLMPSGVGFTVNLKDETGSHLGLLLRVRRNFETGGLTVTVWDGGLDCPVTVRRHLAADPTKVTLNPHTWKENHESDS